MGAAKQIRRYLELIFVDPKRARVSVWPASPDPSASSGAVTSPAWGDREFNMDALAGDGFRLPLVAGAHSPAIDSPELHVYFLRQCELYRVLELLQRTTPSLVEIYSRFRERGQFVDTLQFRYFETSETILSKLDPGLVAAQQYLFDHLYELRIYLRYTDALPSHVEKYINDALLLLIDSWNRLANRVQADFRWEFKNL